MLFQPLLLGILLFQVLYSLVQWLSSRRNEFIYYAGYAIILAGYFFLKSLAVEKVVSIGDIKIRESLLDRQLVYFAIYIYVEFGRSLLGITNKKFAVDKKILLARRIMLSYIFASLLWSLLWPNNKAQEVVHVIFATLTFSFFVYVLTVIYKAGFKLGRLLVLGSLLMGVGAMIALFARIASEFFGYRLSFPPIIFLEIGVVFELICLNTALIYKTKIRQEAQNFRKASQHQKHLVDDLQAIRAEISDELKIELVDGLSDIKSLSDAVQQKTGDASTPELQRISENSERLIKSMNEIVWSLNQHNDRLANMITYLQQYALQLMQQVNLDCKVTIPEKIPELWVYSDARRNIFLAFKEAVHNIVKHSGATEVSILFSLSDHLHISIKDNGKGLNAADSSEFGNGLRNMNKRMKMLRGHFTIKAVKGTHIVFTMPLSTMVYQE